MITPKDITGVILCGGEARRMFGIEKPLQPLHDAPLVHHVRAKLAPQVGRVIIVANRELTAYAHVGEMVISDITTGLGPLGGVQSALSRLETPWMFVCPGDAPHLSPHLVTRLAAAIDATDATNADIAIPHDGERAQHLFVLMRATCRESLETYIASGERSVRGWIDMQRHAVVDAADLHDSFLNINTEHELLLASQTQAQTHHHPPQHPPHPHHQPVEHA